MFFLSRNQIRKYDELAINEYEINSKVLMENAGRGAAQIVLKYLSSSGYVAIICGSGNNGGDGFVIARHLFNQKKEVKIFLTIPETNIKGDALYNLNILKKFKIEIIEATNNPISYIDYLENADVIVDALFGTGINKELKPPFSDWVDLINKCNKPVIAIDIPSGLDADTGRPLGNAVKADETVTFAALKTGLILYPGAGLAGKIHVATIGAPDQIIEQTGYEGRLLTGDYIISFLKSRQEDSHKGTYGHLAVMAGSAGKSGAAVLCGEAAMRTGVGLTTILSSFESQKNIENKTKEVMVEHIIEKDDSPLTEEVIKKLVQFLNKKTGVAIGPGCGVNDNIKEMINFILHNYSLPVVIDADGITNIAEDNEIALNHACPLILTPHPGEMARLAEISTKEVQLNRIEISRQMAKKFNAIIVLKGAHSVIVTPEGETYINPTGNPGMASGGMGDLLTGMIAGFLAQSYNETESALLGVYLHGFAGDVAAKSKGIAPIIASDLLIELPGIINSCEKHERDKFMDKIEFIY